ncbi:MAG: Bax inhibitor-1/YccA family protein [Acidimicrobiia bacterium]|nr:Bax inhibitor-1/YccA family protein [Acidimicrobiia bacterium]
MSNPVLTPKAFERAATEDRAGWAAPGRSGAPGAPSPWQQPSAPPIDDGPISPWTTSRMTLDGTVHATLALFALLLAGAFVGWLAVGSNDRGEVTSFPGWLIVALLGGLGLAFYTAFRPRHARYTAPAYALVEGLVVGAISHVYESLYDGIVVQAALATAGVFAAMLFLYSQRIVRVTDRLRRGIVAATFGVLAVYLVGFVASLFGSGLSFINSPSLLGIGFSVVVAGIAAFNLLLDFDFIERGSEAGAPAYMNWYGAFGLLVTVVWLYLELLRLLSKLQRR